MRLTLFLVFSFLFLSPASSQPLEIDFGSSTGGGYWYVTNDGVMGGLSEGSAFLTDSSVIFSGDVSLENNGGFSSLRSPYQRYRLNEYEEIELRAKSSGLAFSITFSKSQRFYIPNYKYMLDLNNEEWTVINFKLSDLKEYRLGNATGSMIRASDIRNLISISFFNEGKQDGPFTLEIDYIRFK